MLTQGAGGRRRRPTPAGVRTTRWPASSISVATPTTASAASSTRTRLPSVAQRLRSSVTTSPRPVTLSRRARRVESASSRAPRRAGRSTGPAPNSARQVPPAPAGPGQSMLSPRPTTTATAPLGLASNPGPPSNMASASTPASFSSLTRTSLGHLSTGPTPATRRQASAAARAMAAVQRCSSAGSRSGRKSTEARRDAPGGDSHRRSRRPRPALWCSATATIPSGAPRRAWRCR